MKSNLFNTIFFLLISCTVQNEQKTIPKSKIIKITKSTSQNNDFDKPNYGHYKNIQSVVTEKKRTNRWLSSNFYPNFCFGVKKDTVLFQFNGQCYMYFPYFVRNDQIVLIFDTIENCTDNPLFLATKNKPPKTGDHFMILEQFNDSVLISRYLFSKWASELNQKVLNNPPFQTKFISIIEKENN